MRDDDRFISLKELKEHIKLEELNLQDLFTDEQLKSDPEVVKLIEAAHEQAKKDKKKEEEAFDLVPDVGEGKGEESNDDDSLIPD